MILVRYEKDGVAYSDFTAEETVRAWVAKGGDQEHSISSESVVQAFRLLVSEGTLSHEDLAFEFEGKRLAMDRYGHLDDWPNGFCDTVLHLLERTVDAEFAQVEKEDTASRPI